MTLRFNMWKLVICLKYVEVFYQVPCSTIVFFRCKCKASAIQEGEVSL